MYTIEVADKELTNILALLQGMNDDEFDKLLSDLVRLAAVTAETNGIIYPVQREPVTPKPRYSKKTGKLLKPRKNKQYIRTGRLGASLTSGLPEKVEKFHWKAQIGTNTGYGAYVVGTPDDDPGQAWFHQGHWIPLQYQLESDKSGIIEAVKDEANRRLNAYFKR